MRYYYRTASFAVRNADGAMVDVTSFDADDKPVGWLGDWVECSRLCNASRSGVCLENPILTRHLLKMCVSAIRPYIPSRIRPVREFIWASVESIALGDPHPVTGKPSPTTMFIVSLYREGQTPDASGGEDQPDSQSDSAS